MALPFIQLGTVAANNILYLLSLVLGGYFAALLARRFVGWWPAAWLAGVVYSFSAYHLARGNGHFNLTEVQRLPLYLLLFFRAADERARHCAALAGLVLLVIAYTDLYYLVFAVLASLLYLGYRAVSCAVLRRLLRPLELGWRWRWLDAVLLAALAAIVGLLLVSGVDWDLGIVRFRAHTLGPPLKALLAGLVVKAWLVGHRDGLDMRGWARERARDAGTLAIILAMTVAGFTPVLLGIRSELREVGPLLQSDDTFRRLYAANVQGLLLPRDMNPNKGWQDDWRAELWPPSSHWIGSGIEGCTYPGTVAILLALMGLGTAWRVSAVRFFALTALVFLGLALGPSLHIGDLELWRARPHSELLPINWLKDLPILGAVRVTSRFVVVVQLAIAILGTFGTAEIAARLRQGRWGRQLAPGIALSTGVLAACDVHPGRLVPRTLVAPEGLALIADDPRSGTVLEVPLNWSSGTLSFGTSDMSFFHQTVHGRPIFSGHASRYPSARLEQLHGLPLVGRLMAIQQGARPFSKDAKRDRAFARAHRIRWVVVNWHWSPSRRTPLLLRYLRSLLDLKEVYSDGKMTVLEVLGLNGASAP